MEEQKSLINLLKSHGRPKYLANVIDIINSSVFLSYLTILSDQHFSLELAEVILKVFFQVLLTFLGVNTRHRHYSASFIMVSQGYSN